MNITGEQVRAAYAAAPAPIRVAFSSEDTVRILMSLQARHKLHVDVAGLLGKHVGYLLLGLMSPMEFLGALIESGVSAEVAKDIVNEINEQIFIPLRSKMQGVAQTPVPVVQQKTVTLPEPVQATPAPGHAEARQVWAGPPSTLVAERAPQEPTPTATVYATHTQQWPGAPAGNWQPAAAVHVYVPGPTPIHMNPVPQTPLPTQTAPVYQPAPQPVATPTQTQPAFNTIVPIPAPPPVRPTAPPPQNLPGAPIEPLEKAYVADPYHEPI